MASDRTMRVPVFFSWDEFNRREAAAFKRGKTLVGSVVIESDGMSVDSDGRTRWIRWPDTTAARPSHQFRPSHAIIDLARLEVVEWLGTPETADAR